MPVRLSSTAKILLTARIECLLTFRVSVPLFQACEIFSIRFCSWTGKVLIDRALFRLVNLKQSLLRRFRSSRKVCNLVLLFWNISWLKKHVLFCWYDVSYLQKPNQPTNEPTNKQVNLKPGHHTESKEYKMARIFAINYKFFEGDGVTPFPLNQSTKAISMMIT